MLTQNKNFQELVDMHTEEPRTPPHKGAGDTTPKNVVNVAGIALLREIMRLQQPPKPKERFITLTDGTKIPFSSPPRDQVGSRVSGFTGSPTNRIMGSVNRGTLQTSVADRSGLEEEAIAAPASPTCATPPRIPRAHDKDSPATPWSAASTDAGYPAADSSPSGDWF